MKIIVSFLLLLFMYSCIPVPQFTEKEEVVIEKTYNDINVKYIRYHGSAPDQDNKTFVCISKGNNNDTILWYRKVKDIVIHTDSIFIKLDDSDFLKTTVVLH